MREDSWLRIILLWVLLIGGGLGFFVLVFVFPTVFGNDQRLVFGAFIAGVLVALLVPRLFRWLGITWPSGD